MEPAMSYFNSNLHPVTMKILPISVYSYIGGGLSRYTQNLTHYGLAIKKNPDVMFHFMTIDLAECMLCLTLIERPIHSTLNMSVTPRKLGLIVSSCSTTNFLCTASMAPKPHDEYGTRYDIVDVRNICLVTFRCGISLSLGTILVTIVQNNEDGG